MRGKDEKQAWMFSYITTEKHVSKDHPLRDIRAMVYDILMEKSPAFETMLLHEDRESAERQQSSHKHGKERSQLAFLHIGKLQAVFEKGRQMKSAQPEEIFGQVREIAEVINPENVLKGAGAGEDFFDHGPLP